MCNHIQNKVCNLIINIKNCDNAAKIILANKLHSCNMNVI
jgi:hypothetical protein